MSYCSCNSPKEVKSYVGQDTFKVCSKNKGGCGREICSEKKNDSLVRFDDLVPLSEYLTTPIYITCNGCSGKGLIYTSHNGFSRATAAGPCKECGGKGWTI